MRLSQNIFYLIVGIVALVEVGIFWVSLQLDMPVLIQLAVILGIILLYFAQKNVERGFEDERTQFIAQKAAMSTLEVFWVIFFIISLGDIIIGLNRPVHIRPPSFPGSGSPPPDIVFPVPLISPEIIHHLGFFQLGMLCLIIFLYIGFRIYYGRKYGASDSDEE